MAICVLRLGHRIFRDKRITTHLFLTARAFGAKKGYYTGDKDEKLEESIRKIAQSWGGDFTVEHTKSPKELIKGSGAKTVHLTVYGESLDLKAGAIRKEEELLVIVGGEKVPFEYYKLADYNIAVGSQPHSEVAALSMLLDRYFEGKQLGKKFSGAKLFVVPSEKGKDVRKAKP